jgi:hypothetical protein
VAKAGYYGGDPEKVLSARVDIVMDLIDYEAFTSDYEARYMELNRENN